MINVIKKQTKVLSFSFWAFLFFLSSGILLSANAVKKNPVVAKVKFDLVMIESHSCPYCRAWVRDVGDSYHKTAEGKFAPLSRVTTDEAKEQFNLNVSFTPTFIILKNGKEVGRLIGYIDDSFFWPKLDNILAKHGFKEEEEPS